MGVLLIAMLVAYYMTRNTVQDLVYKATGQDPPSYRREQERIARREARRPLTEKREARKFWANAWADAWESAGEKRERIHNKRQQQRRKGWDREDFAEAEDEAYDRNRPEVEPGPAAGKAPAHCEVCDAEVPGDEITVATITGAGGERHLVWACPACVAAENNRKPEPAAAPAPTGPVDFTKPVPADTGDTAGDAQIIQFTDWQRPAAGDTTDEENNVSETTNLSAALAYTSNMAANARQGVSSVETSISGLTAGGVTGPTLASLAQAQEALGQAAAAFEAAHAALVRHIQVQEAYAANADAGNKQFVTAD